MASRISRMHSWTSLSRGDGTPSGRRFPLSFLGMYTALPGARGRRSGQALYICRPPPRSAACTRPRTCGAWPWTQLQDRECQLLCHEMPSFYLLCSYIVHSFLNQSCLTYISTEGRYREMREDGWAIGSGMVESTAKQFKARFNGPGMRWSRSGAERLIPIRAAIMSRRSDELWRLAYNSHHN